MAWIESHTVLIRHRKILQLATALSLTPVETVGHMTVFWHAVLEQQEDGNLSSWPDEMIAGAAHYKGDPKLFVSELQSKKWLDGKLLHDWLDYAGRYLTNKYRTANPRKLKAIYRTHKVRLKSALRPPKVGPKSDNQTLPDLTLPDLQKDKPLAFDLFYELYPKKKSKGKAEEAWKKLNPDEQLQKTILKTLERAKTSDEWKKNHGEFIPHPANWIINRGWEDQYTETVSSWHKPKTKIEPPHDPMPDADVKKLLGDLNQKIGEKQ